MENRIDPEGRYEAAGMRNFERQAAQVLDLLIGAEVSRTRDVIQIDYGGEWGIVVLVTPEALEIRLPTVEWAEGTHAPVETSRIWQRLMWAEVAREDGELDLLILQRLLRSGKKSREREFRPCRYCGKLAPPEHRHEKDICQVCASEHLGVVY